ncbi:MAG: PEP/pyruvate-binding domain-containing protein, partial [Pseudomonadota bacterium]
NVPNGFVITAWAYRLFTSYNNLQPEIERLIQATDVGSLDRLYKLSTVIQQLIIRSKIPDDLEEAILGHYRILEEEYGKEVKVALRSSALGEDFMGTSFAGQYRSELNVSHEHIFQGYKEIVASKYGLSAMAYRLNRGIRDEDVDMCVGCLPMVDAISGGVAYSRNPVNIRDASIINSVWGLPKPVVDGSMPSDLFIISRETPMMILRKEVPLKEQKFICYAEEGVCRLDTTGDESRKVSLSDAQALEIARLAVTLEEYYGLPQDIEWAIDNQGSIILLQCRPLKQLEITEKEIESQQEGPSQSIILKGGVTASPGVAAGPVFIVKKEADALQFPKDAVLVTSQSLPRWAALMNRAVAVITEQGSIAGHLASVAREFQVPAIFGVKGALERLKADQVVTVDADGLRVYDGRIDLLLERGGAPKNIMEGSPVYEALKGAVQYIIPLNLLNPDAPSFKPGRCKTFHDITRFCHEKAVHEMFNFGKDHHFPERSSKQLVGDVPMQWWVLNLDDGFDKEVEGRHVELENIVSIPMLAIWEGIMAFPWEGPPPVDGKGFMSVLYQATTNTALTTGTRSKYAEKNYFMISKNYCSLSSRLGFHFSNIETMVGDRPGENYISFQFKGGAADSHRRIRRVFFIKEVLEEYGFRVEIREDHLLARMENYEKDFMRARLKVLGYLTIHTRQLDMIMANATKVNYYRSKIFREIGEMISQ